MILRGSMEPNVPPWNLFFTFLKRVGCGR